MSQPAEATPRTLVDIDRDYSNEATRLGDKIFRLAQVESNHPHLVTKMKEEIAAFQKHMQELVWEADRMRDAEKAAQEASAVTQ